MMAVHETGEIYAPDQDKCIDKKLCERLKDKFAGEMQQQCTRHIVDCRSLQEKLCMLNDTSFADSVAKEAEERARRKAREKKEEKARFAREAAARLQRPAKAKRFHVFPACSCANTRHTCPRVKINVGAKSLFFFRVAEIDWQSKLLL